MIDDARQIFTIPAPAAPDHRRSDEELAGLYALGVLDGDELILAERHLAICARCRQVVKGDRLAVAVLPLAVPGREAPTGFKERLLARGAAELTAPERPARPLTVVPARGGREATGAPRRDWSAWVLPIAALFLALIAGTAAIGQQLDASQVVASRPLQGSAPQGSVTVLVRRSGDASLQLADMPALPSGGVYQAWLIEPNEPPEPAGTALTGNGSIALSGDARGKTVAITVEPAPGARTPSAAPILSAQVPT